MRSARDTPAARCPRRTSRAAYRPPRSPLSPPPRSRIPATSAVVFASRLLADPGIPLDDRIVSPVLLLAAFAIGPSLALWWRSMLGAGEKNRRTVALVTMGIALAWAAAAAYDSADVVRSYHEDGGDLASREWRLSPARRTRLRTAPPGAHDLSPTGRPRSGSTPAAPRRSCPIRSIPPRSPAFARSSRANTARFSPFRRPTRTWRRPTPSPVSPVSLRWCARQTAGPSGAFPPLFPRTHSHPALHPLAPGRPPRQQFVHDFSPSFHSPRRALMWRGPRALYPRRVRVRWWSTSRHFRHALRALARHQPRRDASHAVGRVLRRRQATATATASPREEGNH